MVWFARFSVAGDWGPSRAACPLLICASGRPFFPLLVSSSLICSVAALAPSRPGVSPLGAVVFPPFLGVCTVTSHLTSVRSSQHILKSLSEKDLKEGSYEENIQDLAREDDDLSDEEMLEFKCSSFKPLHYIACTVGS